MLGFGPIASMPLGGTPNWSNIEKSLEASSTILIALQVIKEHEAVDEGRIITACDVPWAVLAKLLEKDPNFIKELTRNPRKFEELIAASYSKSGFEVVLTPRSGDGGKDVIATKRGEYSIRIIDQVKAYSPGTRVTHDDVRAIIGVLASDRAASKAVVTTTSCFQPGILTSKEFLPFMPTRLQLRDKLDVVSIFERLGKGE